MKVETRKDYWKNGNLKYEYSFVNNVRHGLQKWYYDNGQLRRQYHMKNGQCYGICQSFLHDGIRDCVQKRKNDQRNGPEIIFNYR
jgi:antitoxin component YwqK of YwqJK toxin-antitoxin module